MENPSKSLNRLKRRIKKFVSHPLDLRKENGLYLKFNKKYKNFDWSKDVYTKKDVREILDDENFRTCDGMFNSNHLDYYVENKKTYIYKFSLEEEFLRREMCASMDDKMWRRSQASRKNIKCKTGPRKLYYLRGVGKLFCMGKLPKKMKSKVDKIKTFLISKKYIFDRKSEFFLKDSRIRHLISQKLLYGKESKFNEFLAEYLRKK